MAFATSDDMIARYDQRTLGDLCSDVEGERVSVAAMPTNSKMSTALESASGRILATCLRAKRYSLDDLNALTGESLEYLKDLTCRIAFWFLWKRKPYAEDQQRVELKKEYDEALEELGNGHAIFNVEAVKDAGLPQIETVTRVEIESDWHLFVDEARGNFYPARRSYKGR